MRTISKRLNVLSLNDLDFTYDRMNRLKTAVSVFDIDYTYDSMGNRTQQVEDTITTNYTYSNMMRLLSKTEGGTSTTFGYDRNGNLTSKTEGNSSYTYVWDYDNRLKEVRENGNLLFSYTYDPNGRRVRSLNSDTGVTTTYVYAGINVIYEETSSESTDYLYANGMRIAKKTGATVKYFHPDHLGSTRLVTDSSGQPTYESDYKPFGQDANSTGTEKYAFTGQYSEADIGLYYFGARWYDASLGRFISEDPLKGSMLSSQSQNPYVYCMNNPLRYVDPTGMMGDIPDWSLPENYFDGYVNSVGSLINNVSNLLLEINQFSINNSPLWNNQIANEMGIPGSPQSSADSHTFSNQYGSEQEFGISDDYSGGPPVTTIEVGGISMPKMFTPNVPHLGVAQQYNVAINPHGESGRAEAKVYPETQLTASSKSYGRGPYMNIPLVAFNSFEDYESQSRFSGGFVYNSPYWIGGGLKIDGGYNLTPFISIAPPGLTIFGGYRHDSFD